MKQKQIQVNEEAEPPTASSSNEPASGEAVSRPTFTPGPWQYYTGKLRPQFATVIHEIQDTDGTAIISWGGFDGVDFSQEEIAANAKLIAAAPALYEALIALLPYLSTEAQLLDYASLNEGRASGFDVASVKARAALALVSPPDTSASASTVSIPGPASSPTD